MIIKKYQGKTENEAIAAAKKEMGNSVVIMNTKKIKKKGLFLFLKPQMFEITAAVEEESEQENKKEEVSQNTQIPEKKKEPADSFSDARDVIKSIAAIQSAAGDPFEKKEEFFKREEKGDFKVTSTVIRSNCIHYKIVAENLPDFCIKEVPSLEDAYVYCMLKEEI